MISRENVLREQLAEYENQRARNRREELHRREEVCARSDAAARMLGRREEIFYARMRAAFARPEDAQRIADGLEAELDKLNQSLRAELARLGLPEDYLQPVYRCSICRDTGYVGEPIHEQCACLRQRVMNRLYQDENLSGLDRENFQTFNEQIFPDEPIEGTNVSQRAYMSRMRDICMQYADAFPEGAARNLLLCGASGLGKTFLMNCVAQRVLERGYTVLRITAYRLIEVMRRYHWNGQDAQTVDEMRACDLLVLDDLGTEPMIENVTIESLYHILNERIIAEKGTLISTNLTPTELQSAYTERVASRLLDTRLTRLLRFAGRDVRLAGRDVRLAGGK